MINIAHASRAEKAALTLKKARAAKRKKQHQFNCLEEEEKQEILKRRNARDLKQEAQLVVWDFKHNSLARVKYKRSLEILNERLEEIDLGNLTEYLRKERDEIEFTKKLIGDEL